MARDSRSLRAAQALPGRILIAEDEAVTRTRLEGTLTGWGYSVEVARDGAEAWEILRSESPPSLAILDWLMPSLDGLEICRRLRERPGPYVYVLLLTSKTEKADVVRGLDAGADDYIAKPFDVEELSARLRTGRRIVQLEHDLREQATRDVLTGLWSRRAVLELLPRELERAARDGSELTVALADLDYFKRINDTYGHLGGDSVLAESAKRVRQALRPYDYVGRYGGEEILIILPSCGEECAHLVTERVRAEIAAIPFDIEGARTNVTVSIGFCTVRAGPRTVPVILERADAALYRAKALGRNRVEAHRHS